MKEQANPKEVQSQVEVQKNEALYITTEGSLPVHKPMTKGEIKAFYSISYVTLKKWLRPILDKIDYTHKRVFLTKDLRIIRELMDGIPVNAPSNREEI